MVDEQQTTRGFKLGSMPTFGCAGCESRKQIMGAGNWQTDLIILLVIAVGIAVILKVKVA